MKKLPLLLLAALLLGGAASVRAADVEAKVWLSNGEQQVGTIRWLPADKKYMFGVKQPNGTVAERGYPADALWRVLSHPTVADKTFLITIADRTVTGTVHRDQMCGPFQLPVADNAVVTTGYKGYDGAAMACGERAPVAVVDAPASGRLAVAEAVLNLASAGVPEIGQIKLSANWMAACGEPGQDAALYDTVRAVAMEFCPAAGLSIPVGKDSCSMSTVWSDGPMVESSDGPDAADHSTIGPSDHSTI